MNLGYIKIPINPLPNSKFLDMTKLKAFAAGKLNVAKMTIFLSGRTENTVGKCSMVSLQCFPKPHSLRSLKVGIVNFLPHNPNFLQH